MGGFWVLGFGFWVLGFRISGRLDRSEVWVTGLRSSGVYICKSVVNYLRHGNYICKSEDNYLTYEYRIEIPVEFTYVNQ